MNITGQLSSPPLTPPLPTKHDRQDKQHTTTTSFEIQSGAPYRCVHTSVLKAPQLIQQINPPIHQRIGPRNNNLSVQKSAADCQIEYFTGEAFPCTLNTGQGPRRVHVTFVPNARVLLRGGLTKRTGHAQKFDTLHNSKTLRLWNAPIHLGKRYVY